MKDWEHYQENVAEHFRSLGCEAETNRTIIGARASHAIDVHITFERWGG